MSSRARNLPGKPPGWQLLPLVGLLLPACAEDLQASGGPADGGGDAPPVSSVQMGQLVHTTIDATSSEAWIHFDFETDRQALAPDGADRRSWDLAFQRFKVKSNGGVSGAAGVEVAVLDGQKLDSVTAAPSGGWRVDEPDGEDGNPDPDTVFNHGTDTWFEYDARFHSLAPKVRVYVVRTADDGFFALEFVRYYDAAGDPGFLQFRWKKLAAPAGRIPAEPGGDGGPGDAATSDGGAG